MVTERFPIGELLLLSIYFGVYELINGALGSSAACLGVCRGAGWGC